jgi:molybdenum cofactor biosynthesis enzyme MoaA
VNVNLELTDHCNLKCRMCSQSLREEAHGAPMRFMDAATWRASIEGLRGLRDVALCPHWLGEPTLHPDFDALVAWAFEQNAGNALFRHFKLHTNAVLLPETRARLLLTLANRDDQAPDTFAAVHFSIDALGADTYATVKGAPRHAQVYRNVTRFLELRATMGPARPHVHLAMVVQPENAHEVEGFVERWAATLATLGRPFALTGDWPDDARDAIYLRRLNTGDQAAADRLHADACGRVGIPTRPRPPGSF